MAKILTNWVIMALAILVTGYILPGVIVSNFTVALLVALVLGFFNAFIKPLLIVLTLPINIFTLGLFTLVINASLVLLTAVIVPSFKVMGFWWAILFSVILTVILFLAHLIFKNQKTLKNN